MKRFKNCSSSSTRSFVAALIALPFALSAVCCADSARAQTTTPQTADGTIQREKVGSARWVWSIDRTSPRVAFSLLVRAGAGDEAFETAGWRRVLAQAMLNATLVTKATQLKTARDAQLDNFGARLGANVNDDAIEFWATGDSAHADRVLDMLLQVVRYPRLSDEDIVQARATVRSQRASTFNDVASLATEALDTRLYRDFANRPIAYGLPDFGSAQALDAISAAKLRDLHGRWLRPVNFTFGATGDLNVTSLRSRLTAWNKEFSINALSAPKAPSFSAVVSSEPVTLSLELGGTGDWVFVSYRVSDAAQNDLPALQVLSAALGASPLGRVPQRLLSVSAASSTRSLSSAAQQASVVLVPRRWGGELVLFAQAPPRDAPNALTMEKLRDALLFEVQQMRSRPLTQSELISARRYAIGTWALDRESLRARAFRLALDEEWRSASQTRPAWMSSGRAPQNNEYSNASWATRVQNVTVAQVQNVARRYLNTGATVYIRSGQSVSEFFGLQ